VRVYTIIYSDAVKTIEIKISF